MKAIPVLALVDSRLRSDVILIRLRRAGIDRRKISVVFPRRFIPNAVACWLDVPQKSAFGTTSEPLLSAGAFRADCPFAENGDMIAESIERAGFDPKVSSSVARRLESGATLLCVHAEREEDVLLARQVFEESAADLVATGDARAGAAVPLGSVEAA